jgi:phosphatidylserine/phosphatidylglycerophosphate/cardiolipin synthase-like enzyme
MFVVNSRARIVHMTLIVMFLFGAAVPTTALAKPSVIQNDLANSSDDANALQTSTVLLACDPGSYTFPDFGPVCSGASPGTSLTEEFDVSGRIPYLGGGDVTFKIQCEGVGCVPQDIYYAASMDVTFSDPWGTPHDWDASLTNEIHFTTTTSEGISNHKCGVNVASGECHLEISGVIPAEIFSENPEDWDNHYFTIHAYVSSPLSWVDYDIHTVVQVSLDPIVDCPGVTLSPIAQAVLAEVEEQEQAYCGNQYDGLITLPPGEQAFQRFSVLAEDAKYEVDFTTMLWDENVTGIGPGRTFLSGIKELHNKVIDPVTAGDYADGVRVRILVGQRKNILDLLPFLGTPHPWEDEYQNQHARILEDINDLNIPLSGPNWNVEVALYNMPEPRTHSHVKLMIVDGNKVVTGGYNMQYVYLNESTRRDMGVEVSGPIAYHALAVFDELWADAISCVEVNWIGDCTESIATLQRHPALNDPIPEGNDVVFSLFRDDADKTADDAIEAAINAAEFEVNVIQNRFMNNDFLNPPQYASAILNALQKGDGQVAVNILVSGSDKYGKLDDLSMNTGGICTLIDQLVFEDPIGWVTHRLTARFSDNDKPIHTKALSIDNSFTIIGSQNFDLSAWGNDASLGTAGDLAEYSLGIQSIAAANDFNNYFDEEFDLTNGTHDIVCPSIDSQTDLQDVIDQASPGSAIFIPAGVYTETITINKPLTLVGENSNQTVLHPEGNGPAFRITSSDVSIVNMKISGGNSYGIELIDTSPSSLKDIQINRVVFENNAQGGVLAQGLIPGSPMNYSIENSTFIGGADGITVNMLETQAETSFVRNNIFSEQSNAPIHILSSNDSNIEYSYNLFDDCGLGACTTNWIQGNMSASSSAHDNLFDLNPLFASPANGAYQLSTGSPAIDAGDPELFHDFFYDGNEDGFVRIDMGAFEYAPIENVAPVVDAGTDQNVELGNPVTINATYTDADNSENHSARIDWGDGVVEDVPVTMTGPGAGEVIGEHSYTSSGNYTVEICVTDLYGAVGCDTVNITVNADSFPSTSILDDFNRANGGIGSNWSGNTGKYTVNANQLKVISNASNSDIYWSSQAFGADQEAYFTFSNVSATSKEQNLLLKSQSNTTWGYGVLEVWYDAPNQRVQVWTYEWPAGWVQHGADIPVTFAVGDQFGARALADGTVEVYKNGTLLATRDITSWLYYNQGGYIGLWFSGAQNTKVDDFGGGAISGGQQSMLARATTERNVTAAQLNVTVNSATQFWQGVPLGQTASVTFSSLQASVKPQSNGVWGEGTVQVLYDVPNQRIQVWMYDTTKGWMQIGKNIPVKFTAGDTFSVRALSDSTVEISRNGKLFARRRVMP